MRSSSVFAAVAIFAAAVMPNLLAAQERGSKQIAAPSAAPRFAPSPGPVPPREEQAAERLKRCGGNERVCATFERLRRQQGGLPPFIGGGMTTQVFRGTPVDGGIGVPRDGVPPPVNRGSPVQGSAAAPQPSPRRTSSPGAQPSSSKSQSLLSEFDVNVFAIQKGNTNFIAKVMGQGFEMKPGRIRAIAETTRQFEADDVTLAPRDPALLAVGITYDDGELCTGVLVGPRHVLTAGHCACGNPSTYNIFFDNDARPPHIGRKLAHPPILFDHRSCPQAGQRLFGKDLGLLVLDGPFRCDQAIGLQISTATASAARGAEFGVVDCDPALGQPGRGGSRMTFGYPPELFVQLQPSLSLGQRLLVVGYGYTDEVSLGLRAQGAIPIKSVACTEQSLHRFCQPFTEFLLAEKQGPGPELDSCRGDSGGPVFLREGENYTLIGITSRAAPGIQSNSVGHCGGGGIYTIIGRQSVIDWLRANGVPAAQRLTLAPVR